MLPDILAACDAAKPGLGIREWVVQCMYPTEPDTIAAAVGQPEGSASAVLIVARSEQRKNQLARRIRVEQALAAISGIDELRKFLPQGFAFDVLNEQPYILQQHLSGMRLGELRADDVAYTRAHVAALRTIDVLHRSTATEVKLGEEHLRRWVDEPLQFIEQWLQLAGKPNGEAPGTIRRIEQHMREVLKDQPAVVSWIHGDFWDDNILVNPAGTDVTGIIDWEWAVNDGLPSFDVVNLLLSRRWLMSGGEWGDTVIDVLRAGEWTASEHAMVDTSSFNELSRRLGTRTLVLLGWLWHIRCNLPRTRRHLLHRKWFTHNVANVLREIRGGIPLA